MPRSLGRGRQALDAIRLHPVLRAVEQIQTGHSLPAALGTGVQTHVSRALLTQSLFFIVMHYQWVQWVRRRLDGVVLATYAPLAVGVIVFVGSPSSLSATRETDCSNTRTLSGSLLPCSPTPSRFPIVLALAACATISHQRMQIQFSKLQCPLHGKLQCDHK